MDNKLTLYFFPGSYYSTKACMVLYEKGVQFEEVHVNIRSGEQRSDWYMKINPKGEVPALKHGEHVVVDSENIIDYVDKTFPQEPRLVPDITTPIGQDVQELRRLLNTIKIDHITYGQMANENLRVGEIKICPKFLLNTASKQALGYFNSITAGRYYLFAAKEYNESIKDLNDKLFESLKNLSEIQWKIKDLEEKRDVVLSEEKTAAALDTLEPIFDKLEERLEKTKRESDGNENYWLTGGDFTAADITTSILLYRMWIIGLDERYFTQVKRPLLCQYYTRVQHRPGFQKMAQDFNKNYILIKKDASKGAFSNLVKIGAVVGLVGFSVYAVREFSKKYKRIK